MFAISDKQFGTFSVQNQPQLPYAVFRFRLDAGDGEDRQILSGIAKFYPNEQELVGKKLQVVANLKPRKMMKKYVSQGMILSAEHDGKLTVLTVDPSVPNGSVIG